MHYASRSSKNLLKRPAAGGYRRGMRPPPLNQLAVLMILLLAGCGGTTDAGSTDSGSIAASAPSTAGAEDASEQRYPDIVEVKVTPAGDDTYDLAVTVLSPYDTPQRYADGWRVLAADGTELGTHTLAHDHAGEQPFTRTQAGVEVPGAVDEITVEGRDQQYGYGGKTVTVKLRGG